MSSLEQKLDKLHVELKQIEDKLADATLYQESHKKDLATLLQKQATLKSEANAVEEQWLEKNETLESQA